MPTLSRRDVLALLLAAPAAARSFAEENAAPWISLFDGRSLRGWRPPGTRTPSRSSTATS